jgi:hypothetical protein
MEIYNFYNRKTSGPICNFLSKWLPGIKLVDYKILNIPNNLIYGDSVKVFTLGYDVNCFDFLISKGDILSINSKSSHLARGKMADFYKNFMGGSSNTNKELIDMKSFLLSIMRNYKIDDILS